MAACLRRAGRAPPMAPLRGNGVPRDRDLDVRVLPRARGMAERDLAGACMTGVLLLRRLGAVRVGKTAREAAAARLGGAGTALGPRLGETAGRALTAGGLPVRAGPRLHREFGRGRLLRLPLRRGGRWTVALSLVGRTLAALRRRRRDRSESEHGHAHDRRSLRPHTTRAPGERSSSLMHLASYAGSPRVNTPRPVPPEPESVI